jgi:hypothetical protein
MSLAQELVSENMYSMLVWVLEANHSRYFYEALGGKQIDSQPIEIGGTTLTEIAYGWDNINSLFFGK